MIPSVTATTIGARPSTRLPTALVVAPPGERYSIGRELIDCGFNVVEAIDAAEAVERLEGDDRIGIVLFDDPDGSRQEAKVRTWLREHSSDILLFVASGDEMVAAAVDVLCENEVYLTRPYNPAQVAQRIRAAMEDRGG